MPGFRAVISLAKFVHCGFPMPKPKISLFQAAREDNVCRLFDLLSQRPIRGPLDARGAIGSSSDRDDDVVTGPFDISVRLKEIFEGNLELRAAMSQCGFVIGFGRISAPPEPDKLGGRASKLVIEGGERQPAQKSIQFSDVIRVFRAYEKVNVDEVAFRRTSVESQLDVSLVVVSKEVVQPCSRGCAVDAGVGSVVVSDPVTDLLNRLDAVQVELQAIRDAVSALH